MPKFDLAFFSSKKVKNYDLQLPRNPSTKILRGAEPLELGNPYSNTALLMVHGFAGCPNNFENLPQKLAELDIFVKAILLPGHGTSPLDFEKVSVDILLESVVDNIIDLKKLYKTVIVLGHSMGGALSTLSYVKTNFDGLILASPYYGITPNPKLILPPEKWIQYLSPFVRWVFTPPEQQPILRQEVATKIVSYHWIPSKAGLVAMEIAERAKRDAILAQITCPTLVIHSKKDSVACPNAVAQVFEKIQSQQKEMVWLENSDHVIFWDHDRDFVITKISEFIMNIKKEKST